MDDLASKISELLQSPDSMEQIKSMADALLSGNAEKPQESQPPPVDMLGGMGDIIDMGSLMKIANILKNSATDNRSQLLLALKPHLSADRQPRVDKAVKILKLVSLVPIFKEQGILNF